MWVTGLVGMATKFAEALVAVKYRRRDENGQMVGGPMLYIAAIGPNPFWKYLATVFAVFACIASFGIGNMVQSNSVADALHSSFGTPKLATGIVLAILTAVVILGGIKWIGRFASAIVPIMIVSYCSVSIYILALAVDKIPGAFALIFESAFTPTAASGGFAGASIWIALRMGVARGIFSNESGLGSSPIAAAAAKTKEPVSQALVSMTQTFIDTLIVCTMTALVIICSGVWDSGSNGAKLTTEAFSAGLNSGYGGIVVSLALVFFAYSTLLGWSYYGERALESLVGVKWALPYKIVFCVLIVVGAVSKLDVVWLFSDIANALMAFPNLIGLLALSPVIAAETKRYLAKN
jgi:AGCS family alanine or glycine:cation symporter